MGMLDGMASMAGPIGGVVAGIGNYFSADAANRAASRQSQEQMDFQERMSSTAYQRATGDMEKAGLNPMLAYSQGGASTPAGSAAPVVQKLGPAMNSAVSAAQQIANTQQIQESARKTGNEADALDMDNRITKTLWDEKLNNTRVGLRASTSKSELDSLRQEWYKNPWTDKAPDDIENYQKELRNLLRKQAEDTGSAAAAREAAELKLPGMRNVRDSDLSFWGKNIRPYLDDAEKVGNSAGSMAKLLPWGKKWSIGGKN
ncbi:MAG: DNA pilot protein [Microvirus sp.]|nr:MAG: DNA pilot protein [Microvirus sp.]